MAEDYTDATERLREHTAALSAALSLWSRHETTHDPATARWGGRTAVEHVDVLLAGLHDTRRRLIAELRTYDDAVNARVDAMLAERQQ